MNSFLFWLFLFFYPEFTLPLPSLTLRYFASSPFHLKGSILPPKTQDHLSPSTFTPSYPSSVPSSMLPSLPLSIPSSLFHSLQPPPSFPSSLPP